MSETPLAIPANPHHDALREALARVDEHLANLRRCVHWLMENRIGIVRADLRRGRLVPHITVDASPRLGHLLGRSIDNVARRHDGYKTILTWAASAHGCHITWEETSHGGGR